MQKRNNSFKYDRISSEIKKELQTIITTEIKDPRIKSQVSITECIVSKDLSLCKVFIVTDQEDKDNVIKLWASSFQDDDPAVVMKAVQKCINTMSYKPTIADIRKRMVQVQVLSEIEAFQAIKNAVHLAVDEESSYRAYNAPTILQKRSDYRAFRDKMKRTGN